MDETLQHVLVFVCFVLYLPGAVILVAHARAKQIAYLRQFPPVAGVRLDTFTSGNPFGPVARAIREVTQETQADPVLERQRRAVRWAFGALATWTIGYPMLGLSVAALLILVGLVHPH